jgi:hypothetical protein
MKKVMAIAGIFVLMTCLWAIVPQVASAQNQENQENSVHSHSSSPLVIPVTAAGGGFTGTFKLTSFAIQNGQLVANGIVAGTDANGVSHFGTATTAVTSTRSTAALIAAAPAVCSILHLVLGPINLNVLGLQVMTNQIVLDINAIPGAGNLLGNLLCDVANLLNGNPTQTLVGLLNQIIAILQGL